MLDPEQTTNKGINKNEVFDGEENNSGWRWLTEEQLASPEWLNSVAHAKILVDSGDMTPRPHEWESLAKAGVHQHHFNWSLLNRRTGWKKTAGTLQEVELKPEEVKVVNDSIVSLEAGLAAPVRKKQKTKTAEKPQETEDHKQAKLSKAARTQSLRKLKITVDKGNKDLKDLVFDLNLFYHIFYKVSEILKGFNNVLKNKFQTKRFKQN